jgi:iron complex transport system permease protein
MNKARVTSAIRFQVVILGLLALFALGIVLNANTGTVNIPALKVFDIIFNGADAGSMESNIIWKIRLPRLLTAAVLGGALSVSGFLLQTFFRNPIAGPFVLGISSGAKMIVGFVIIFVVGAYGTIPPYLMVLAAFIGSMLIMGLVLFFSRHTKSMPMLLVIGIMVGYICSAITNFFITFAKDQDIANLTSWSMGSFSGAAWGNLGIICAIVGLSLLLSLFLSKPMDAYRLGEGYAKSMGINIRLFRAALIVVSSVLSACVTAFAGPISFVGIAVPQIAKLLIKSGKPLVVIPACFLCGAVFCMFCDLIARTAFAPTELAIGTVTSLFGAPVVIAMMISRKRQRT